MKYTLITGASSGIGKELALKFSKENHNIIIVARRKELLGKLKTEITSKYDVDVVIKIADLSNNEETHNLYKDLEKYDLEIMINNAGFGDFNNLWESNIEKLESMLDLNIRSLTTLSTLYLKDYKEKNTTLINVSSTVGYAYHTGGIVYSASKFYVSAFTEALDRMLREKNYKMRAKVLAPGRTITQFSDVALDKELKDYDNVEKTGKYEHTAGEMAEFCYKLYKSEKPVGAVNPLTYNFELEDYKWEELNESS